MLLQRQSPERGQRARGPRMVWAEYTASSLQGLGKECLSLSILALAKIQQGQVIHRIERVRMIVPRRQPAQGVQGVRIKHFRLSILTLISVQVGQVSRALERF